MARWTASDPIGIDDGLNTYLYVGANPVRLTDPGGLKKSPPQTPNQNVEWRADTGSDSLANYLKTLSPEQRGKLLDETTGNAHVRLAHTLRQHKFKYVEVLPPPEPEPEESSIPEEADAPEEADPIPEDIPEVPIFEPDPALEDWGLLPPHPIHISPLDIAFSECLKSMCHARHPGMESQGRPGKRRSSPGKSGQSRSSRYTDHTGRKVDAKKRLDRRKGETPKKKQKRKSKEWRDQHMRGSRQHHNTPDVMKADKKFLDRLEKLGVKKPREWIDKQISDLNAIQHADVHARGFTPKFQRWVKSTNYKFTMKELNKFMRQLKRDTGIPKQSSAPKYKGPQRR